jgi:hypothetical protein
LNRLTKVSKAELDAEERKYQANAEAAQRQESEAKKIRVIAASQSPKTRKPPQGRRILRPTRRVPLLSLFGSAVLCSMLIRPRYHTGGHLLIVPTAYEPSPSRQRMRAYRCSTEHC